MKVGRKTRFALRLGRWLGVFLVVALAWQLTCNALEVSFAVAVLGGVIIGCTLLVLLAAVGWGLAEAFEALESEEVEK